MSEAFFEELLARAPDALSRRTRCHPASMLRVSFPQAPERGRALQSRRVIGVSLEERGSSDGVIAHELGHLKATLANCAMPAGRKKTRLAIRRTLLFGLVLVSTPRKRSVAKCTNGLTTSRSFGTQASLGLTNEMVHPGVTPPYSAERTVSRWPTFGVSGLPHQRGTYRRNEEADFAVGVRS